MTGGGVIAIIIALAAIFIGFIILLAFFDKKLKINFSVNILIALGLGLILGVGVQLLTHYKIVPSQKAAELTKWIDIIGKGFTKALQFIIVPLVAVSVVSAIARSAGADEGIKKSGKIILILLVTTAISAVISIVIVKVFNLKADSLIAGAPINKAPSDIPTTILELIPDNLFAAFSSNSVLPVLIISAVVGFAYLAINKEHPEIASKFKSGLDVIYKFVVKIINFIVKLTPYGVLAIITSRAATGSVEALKQLGFIILACFAAMTIVFVLHLAILWILGLNPVLYLKKTSPALLFAFSSRSSAATLPLTIEAERKLGISAVNADLSATLGTCIGQNGCAGVYPVILAMLVGMVQGLNVWSLSFLIPLIIYAVVASIGTAGVGGGAINVSLVVLSFLGLPIELVTILIAVDFIVDMGRTALNVNDGILAGYVLGKWENQIDKQILQDKTSYLEADKDAQIEPAAAVAAISEETAAPEGESCPIGGASSFLDGIEHTCICAVKPKDKAEEGK